MQKILLTGSSIFEQWFNAAEAAPDHTVINRSIGGTTTVYWKDSLATVLEAEQPDILWLYAGSNDLCAETVPPDIVDNLLACRTAAIRHNPALRFVYFSIIKAPQKRTRWAIIDALHTDLRTRLQPDDLFIDLNPLFLRDGDSVPHVFQEDDLHLTPAAYQAMVHLTRPIVERWVVRDKR